VRAQTRSKTRSKHVATKTKAKSFEDRIEEMKASKEKHGHVHVTAKHDKSLNGFCEHIKCARRGTGASRTLITEDRIKALDELGFDWGGERPRPRPSRSRSA